MPYRTNGFVSRREEKIPHKSIPPLDFKTVSSIKRGECFYIIPWAVVVDVERKPWIKKNHPLDQYSDSPGGTTVMKLTRDSDGFLRATVNRDELERDFTETTVDSDLYEKVVEVTIL